MIFVVTLLHFIVLKKLAIIYGCPLYYREEGVRQKSYVSELGERGLE